MRTENSNNIDSSEIAKLAYFAWERDGRPHGRDQAYWLEAESQFKAMRQLLNAEKIAASAMPVERKPEVKPSAPSRTRRNGLDKNSNRRN